MESQEIEYKETWKDEYLRVIAAFANSKGGKLLIGINDKGDIVGVSNIKKLLEDIPNKIKNKLLITPFVGIETLKGKQIISVEILPSSFPVFYEGKIFLRSGSTVQELSGLELSSFLLEKSGKTWDSLPTNAQLDDIDNDTIRQFVSLAKNRLPAVEKYNDTNSLLEKLNLITKEKEITRGAVLLFGKNPQKFFPSAYTKVGRFKTPTTILDTIISEGNLFKQLDDVMNAIKKHLNVRFDTSVHDLSLEGLSRRDIWDYPIDALRESVINAFIHRDYVDSDSIQIKIFDDRISIWNPGKLMPPLTIEKLKEEHQGKQRNPLIASVFYYAGLIEAWGYGTTKMIDLCKKQDLPEPEFYESKEGIGDFKVVFNKDIYTEENLRKMGLNERQIRAILYVKEKGKITNKEYQEIGNTSQRTATRDLSKLVLMGFFEQLGTTGKGTEYIIKKTPQRSQTRQKDAKNTPQQNNGNKN